MNRHSVQIDSMYNITIMVSQNNKMIRQMTKNNSNKDIADSIIMITVITKMNRIQSNS